MTQKYTPSKDYKPLSVETLPNRLSGIAPICDVIGYDTTTWHSKEVGDGNLNLVFIVTGDKGAVIVKQALPYVRVVGEGWPLDLNRAFFEYNALVRQHHRAKGMVPTPLYFDEQQALIVMEFLTPHFSLRNNLQGAVPHENLAKNLGEFCAKTLFKGSEFCLDTQTRKKDLALFAGNEALCKITEDLVFTDPYYNCPRNSYDTNLLGNVVQNYHKDTDLITAVQRLKMKFCNNAETLLHGDLHTGSVMVTDTDVKVIDPEFAIYGPFGFDMGMLMGNFWMAYFAQQGHETRTGDRYSYCEWILSVNQILQNTFVAEFSNLWRNERNGILFPCEIYENQNHHHAINTALQQILHHIWQDTIGFAGVEMIRRTVGLAHISEIDNIPDDTVRATCQTKILQFARNLILNQHTYTMDDVVQHARIIKQGE